MLYSCSENYEQHYKEFSDFNNANLRLKSWFPNLISTDCYDLKEIHNMETNSSFGQFSYKFNNRIDLLLSDNNLYKKMPFDSLTKFLAGITKPKKPNWFPDETQMKGNVSYKKESMFLIKVDRDKKIYFIYSTE